MSLIKKICSIHWGDCKERIPALERLLALHINDCAKRQCEVEGFLESKKVLEKENERLLGELQEQKAIYNYTVGDLENKNKKLEEQLEEHVRMLGDVRLDDIFEAKNQGKIDIKISAKENGKRLKKQ